MLKNRFFKNTLGLFAEVAVVAKASDNETASNGSDATIDVPVTIGATPTAGDKIAFVVDGVTYEYTSLGGTAATNVAGILAMLNANLQGFAVGASGTTSAVFTFSHPSVTWNTKTISLTETGSSYTVAGPYTFAGGVAPDAAAEDTIANFVANDDAGAIWAFWADTNLALFKGDTFNPANVGRKFYYAWKMADGTVKKSSDIPVATRKYDYKAYNAGTAQVSTCTFTGTFSLGQIIHFKIIETTGTQLPYPTYEYDVTIGSGGINAAVAALEALIDAEAQSPFVTAGSSTNVLTITGSTKTRSFKMVAQLETTPAQPTDAAVFTMAYGTPIVHPIGDVVGIKELDTYAVNNSGGILYTPDTYNAEDLGLPASNLDESGTTQYGILMVTSDRSEPGVMETAQKRAYMIIAVRTADVATLAAL